MISKGKYFPLTIVSIILILIAGCTHSLKLSISDLTCESLKDPLGVNTLHPRFSWKNSSGRQETTQTAFQILVADDIKKLNEKEANLWNSGKTASSSNIWVEYAGEPLQSGQLLFWKVRAWDEKGDLSSWSSPARSGIGLLDKSDWTASYIGYPSEKRFHSSPQLRKTFSLDRADKKGIYLLHVNSLGYHEIYMNGKKVSDDVLSPAVSQFNKRSQIVTYDVTPFLKAGNNDLVIWLGSGWYTEGLPGVAGNGPVVRAQMEQLYQGTKETIVYTDSSWKGRESEYASFNDHHWGYGGEIIIANQETRGKVFKKPDALSWESVVTVEIPVHQATPQAVEPNRIRETIHPARIEKLNDSVLLVDMGKGITGWFDITFPPLEEGTQITMVYADHLNTNGDLPNQNQVDKYIASGSGTESFINKFNYRSFQYVKISNLKQAPQLTDIKGHLIHTDFETASSFECSDEDMNRIHNMVAYTLRCLSIGGYLVDCSHLERLGYGGDGNASTPTAQTMFNLAPLYNNWLQAWADVIREDGGMPHTAPNPFSAGGGPYWCGFIISASWNTYQHYGDQHILEKYYPVMQQWLGYVDAHSVDGLLKKWPNTNYRNWYLGDWATPEGVGNPDHIDERSVDLVNNCYLSYCFNQMMNIALVLGKGSEEANYYLQKRDALRGKIYETFYDEEEGIYATGSQIDMIFPMLVGAIPEELREKVTDKLIERTTNEFGGHLNTGLVGIPVMMEWAVWNHQADFIYSMLKKRSYPGYLYMLDQGATATWEHWNGERSRIHNCFNGVGQWFYQAIGGIRMNPGMTAYSEFLVDPQIPEGITWAKTTQMTPYGKIAVHWELHDKKMTMEVEVPVGSTARLIPPKGTIAIQVDNKPIPVSNDPLFLDSGKYFVNYSL